MLDIENVFRIVLKELEDKLVPRKVIIENLILLTPGKAKVVKEKCNTHYVILL